MLEVETRLEFDDTSSQGTLGLSEVRIGGEVRDRVSIRVQLYGPDALAGIGLQRRQVQSIEEVVEIGAEGNLCVLAEDGHGRQAKILSDGEVEIFIARSAEVIAKDTGS